MPLPQLFEGYMMLQDVGADLPAPYVKPLANAETFRHAYSPFIAETELLARGKIARDHVEYLSDLDDSALADLDDWEPTAYVEKVSVNSRGDIFVYRTYEKISREAVFESAMMAEPDQLLNRLPKPVRSDTPVLSPDVAFAIQYFRTNLGGGDPDILFEAFTDRVMTGDAEFTGSFLRWLSKEGNCTVTLRDELCRPFKAMFDDRRVEGRQNLAWDNAWTRIDSVSLAYSEEFRVGGLRHENRGQSEYRIGR